jgi:hypothetical protein
MYASVLLLAAAASTAVAQGAAYAQCGGIGWKGATTCVSGYTCQVSNSYYSQCVPGSNGIATTQDTASRVVLIGSDQEGAHPSQQPLLLPPSPRRLLALAEAATMAAHLQARATRRRSRSTARRIPGVAAIAM